MSCRSLVLSLVLALSPFYVAQAQTIADEVPADTLAQYGIFDTDLLPPSFHAGRRSAFMESMMPGSVALFPAAPEQTRSADIEYAYHQDPNLYYLSGCTEPQSALLLTTEPVNVNGKFVREILFIRERDPKTETWTGKRLGPQGAMNVLHIPAALPIDTLKPFLASLLRAGKGLYLVQPHHKQEPLFAIDTSTSRTLYPTAAILDPTPIISKMRLVKLDPELRLIRKAIAISNMAHDSAIKRAKPGMHEYSIQAIAEGIFLSHGAEYTAYPCIVGSGPNSTILHYESNRRELQTGDFIEMDMGAEYHGYASDVTRSFPVAKNFTPEQRAIYNLVLEAQDSGIAACVAGAKFTASHQAAVSVIARGLMQLGITKDSGSYKQYFMHGTSHFVGLDVHDLGGYLGSYALPLQENEVITVEPGIYIPAGSPCDAKWWNIGCRIEDDILITPHGPENLSVATPRSIEDIEQLRNAQE